MASKRLRNVNKEQGESAKMDMSPMIDMVFLLLLFFLVVSNPKTIKIDPELVPASGTNARPAKSKDGKIVINVRKDGTFRAEDVNITFENDEGMVDYLEEQKERVKGFGQTPVLHLRGDKTVEFTYIRRVIRAAASAGIDQVAYALYNKE